MELHEFLPPDLPGRVDNGEARAIIRGRSTIAEVLEPGRHAMDEEDHLEEYARHSVGWSPCPSAVAV